MSGELYEMYMYHILLWERLSHICIITSQVFHRKCLQYKFDCLNCWSRITSFYFLTSQTFLSSVPPLCAVHLKTIKPRGYRFFVHTWIPFTFKMLLPPRQSHRICSQTKHNLSAETSAINSTRDGFVFSEGRQATDVLQIITAVRKMLPLSFLWRNVGINSSMAPIKQCWDGKKKQLRRGKLPSVIVMWQQKKILCTCWMFVCVLTSQPALFDCSGSAYPCCGSVSACAHFVQGYKGATRIFSQCKLRSDL